MTACGGSSDTVCASCSAKCDACSSATVCTTCAAGYVLNGNVCVFSGKSCLSIHAANPAMTDGVYQLDPDGAGGQAAFFAYCDMSVDGGGWMKALQYKDVAYTPTAAAVGDITTSGTPAMAKLADAQVNTLATLSTMREYRIQGGTSTKKLYMKSSATWDDTARGHGLILTGSGYGCEATSNAACPYVAVTTPVGRPTIDTNDWSPSPIGNTNNLDRYFTDYSSAINCYIPSSATQRCYSTGNSLGHVMIQNLSIWTRELPVTATGDAVVTYTLNENSGTVVNDSSGNGRTGAVLASGSWTPGHTGSSVLGAVRTNAALPLTTSVTVSGWVRRDGRASPTRES